MVFLVVIPKMSGCIFGGFFEGAGAEARIIIRETGRGHMMRRRFR